jgi:hypothetical protein
LAAVATEVALADEQPEEEAHLGVGRERGDGHGRTVVQMVFHCQPVGWGIARPEHAVFHRQDSRGTCRSRGWPSAVSGAAGVPTRA